AEALRRRVVAGDAVTHLAGDAADPRELCAVGLGLVAERRDALAERDAADARAILRRHGIEIVGGLQAAGDSHVLRHHTGIAGNMLSEMSCHESSIGIVAAADAVAD